MRSQMRFIVDRVFPKHRVRTLWLESVSQPYTKQEASRFIRSIDKTITM